MCGLWEYLDGGKGGEEAYHTHASTRFADLHALASLIEDGDRKEDCTV